MNGADQMLTRARDFAIAAHAGQMYGDKPYSDHLDHVVSILKKYVPDDEARPSTLAIGYLHDVLEDTEVTREQIITEFGMGIAQVVWCLTDEPGANRKERKLKTWHKIRSHPVATLVKLADRIANTTGDDKLDMYKKEFPVFQAALYVPGQYENMWADLKSLTNR